jgi:RNase P/RNase MRP subunit POP5
LINYSYLIIENIEIFKKLHFEQPGIIMVVKSKFGRRRYIVFILENGSDITKKDLIYSFNRLLPQQLPEVVKENSEEKSDGALKNRINNNLDTKNDEAPRLRHKLKYFDGRIGILLTPHWQKSQALRILNSIEYVGHLKKPIKLKSVGTSGTLKKAMKKYIH